MSAATRAAKELEKRKARAREQAAANHREAKYTAGAVGTNLGLYGGTLALLKNPWQPAGEKMVEHVQDLAEKMGPVEGARKLHVEIPHSWDLPRSWGPYYDPQNNVVNIPSKIRDSIILHELGHAKNDAVVASKWGNLHLPYRIIEMASRVGSGVTFAPTLSMAARQKENELSYTPGVIQAILASPMLAEEAVASARAVATLVQEHGALKGAVKSLPLLPAFGTYATIAGAPLVVTYLRKRALARKQAREAARMEKRSYEIKPSDRPDIPKKDFAQPKKEEAGHKGKYPIPDRQHAKSALGFAKMHGDSEAYAAVRAKVKAKYPDMLEKTALRFAPNPHPKGTREHEENDAKNRSYAEKYWSQNPYKVKTSQLPGGKADKAGKTASDFNPKALRKGQLVEKEHFPHNPLLAKFIAEDHLTEDPKYYEKLKKYVEKD